MNEPPHAGLERDSRQIQDEFPTVYNNEDQSKYLNGIQPHYQGGEDTKLAPSPSLKQNQICGIRRTTFWLIIALAVALILGVVGAGVAGSLAVKRGHNAYHTNRSIPQPDRSSTPTSPESANAPTTTCPTLPSSTPSIAANCTHVPANDCESLPQRPKAYVSMHDHHEYSIYCTTDFPGNDMFGAFVYSFVDCIETCSSYNTHVVDPSRNSTCVSVSYDITFLEVGGEGNCFLKSSLGDGPIGKNDTSSAVVIKS